MGFPSDPCWEIDDNDDLFVGLPGANSVTFVSSRRDESRVEKQLMDEPKRNKIGMCYVRSKRWLSGCIDRASRNWVVQCVQSAQTVNSSVNSPLTNSCEDFTRDTVYWLSRPYPRGSIRRVC